MLSLIVDVVLGLPAPILVLVVLMLLLTAFAPPCTDDLADATFDEELPSRLLSPVEPPSATLYSSPLFHPRYSMISTPYELKPLFTTAPLELPTHSARRQKQWWPYRKQSRPFRVRLGSVEEEDGWTC